MKKFTLLICFFVFCGGCVLFYPGKVLKSSNETFQGWAAKAVWERPDGESVIVDCFVIKTSDADILREKEVSLAYDESFAYQWVVIIERDLDGFWMPSSNNMFNTGDSVEIKGSFGAPVIDAPDAHLLYQGLPEDVAKNLAEYGPVCSVIVKSKRVIR